MQRPNILLIMTDQQRADSLGHARQGQTDTPCLDRLAQRGVVFDTAYSASSVCVPARSSLLTGLFDTRLPRAPNGLALQEGCWTIVHALAALGYETALFGKMHFFPIQSRHGFQIARSCEHLSAGYGPDDWDDYGVELKSMGLEDPRDDSSMDVFPYDEALHPTRWITRQAIEFLKKRSTGAPYFAIVSYTSPHTPLDPPARYAAMYDPALEVIPPDRFEANLSLPHAFAEGFKGQVGKFFTPEPVSKVGSDHTRLFLAWRRALIRQIDDCVGEVMQHVSLDDTVVFFTSDHGDYGGHRGLIGKVPWIPFEDLARVPFFCVGTGVEGGRRVSAPVQSADFALTSLELAGSAPPRPFFDMESLVPVLRGEPAPEDRAVFSSLGIGWPMIRRGRFKFFWHWLGDQMLFDLENDPEETRNVLDSHGAIAADLSVHLQLQIQRPMFDLRVDETAR